MGELDGQRMLYDARFSKLKDAIAGLRRIKTRTSVDQRPTSACSAIEEEGQGVATHRRHEPLAHLRALNLTEQLKDSNPI